MKKLAVVFLVVFLFVSVSSDLKAERPFDLFGNATFAIDDAFDFDYWLWGLGATADFHITDLIMITPEVNVWTFRFDFDAFWLDTAVVANFKLSNFFLGAGVDKMWNLSGAASSDFSLRLNAGLIGNNIRLTAFLITPFDALFDAMLIGVQIGFGF
jgi:hypothetical protein